MRVCRFPASLVDLLPAVCYIHSRPSPILRTPFGMCLKLMMRELSPGYRLAGKREVPDSGQQAQWAGGRKGLVRFVCGDCKLQRAKVDQTDERVCASKLSRSCQTGRRERLDSQRQSFAVKESDSHSE